MSNVIRWLLNGLRRIDFFRSRFARETYYVNECNLAESVDKDDDISEDSDASETFPTDSQKSKICDFNASGKSFLTSTSNIVKNTETTLETSETTSESGQEIAAIISSIEDIFYESLLYDLLNTTETPTLFSSDNEIQKDGYGIESIEDIFKECLIKELFNQKYTQCSTENEIEKKGRSIESIENIFSDCLIRELLNKKYTQCSTDNEIEKDENSNEIRENIFNDSIIKELLNNQDIEKLSESCVPTQNDKSSPDIVEPDVSWWIIEALDSLKYRFKLEKAIDGGQCGTVCLLTQNETGQKVAAKLIPFGEPEPEIRIWPYLKHPNILPLIEHMKIKDTDIFISPVQNSNLFKLVENREVSFTKIKNYLKDALNGLAYLHNIGLCHLDIKPDNVLIGDEGGMLCDFGFVTNCTNNITRNDIGMCYQYRPPEVSYMVDKYEKIKDKKAVDLWGFGIMMFEILTHFPISDAVPTLKDWKDEVFPMLFKLLQKDEFQKRVAEYFPEADEKAVMFALDLIHRFLRKTPAKRVSASDALRHPLFKEGKTLRFKKQPRDKMWCEKKSTITKLANYYPRILAKLQSRI